MNPTLTLKTIRHMNAVASGNSTQNGTCVDTANFDTVRMIGLFGTITSATLKFQGGAASDGSDAEDISGASVALEDADDNKVAVIEVNKPPRYVRAQITRTDATIDGVIVELGKPRSAPVTADSTVEEVVVM